MQGLLRSSLCKACSSKQPARCRSCVTLHRRAVGVLAARLLYCHANGDLRACTATVSRRALHD